jgi:hypothetical protein
VYGDIPEEEPMPTIPDIDQLLRESAPDIVGPPGLGATMAATARAVTRGNPPHARRVGSRTALPLAVAGVAVLALGGATIAAHTNGVDERAPSAGSELPASTASADELDLVAQKLAPAGLPLPDGVTLDDATAQAVRVLRANPDLQARGRFSLDKGVVEKHPELIPRHVGNGWRLESRIKDDHFTSVDRTGVSATYVFYARCQWERTMLGGQVTFDAGMAALSDLGDAAAYVADGEGVRRVAHEGIAVVPTSLETVRADFDTNCLRGFGDAPEATG